MPLLNYGQLLVGGPGHLEDVAEVNTLFNEVKAVVNALDDDNIANGAGIAYEKLNLASKIVNADVKSDAAIALSKLAAVAEGNVLVGNGSNVLTQVSPSGDVDVSGAGVFTIVDGSLEESMLSPALAAVLDAGNRGAAFIPTEESRTSTAYGLMTTPDVVEDLVLPEPGLIFVAFQALWKGGINTRAAIFLNGNQVQIEERGGGGPGTQAGAPDQSIMTDDYTVLHSCPLGLMGDEGNLGGETSQVTTGQILGAFNDDDGAGLRSAMEVGGTVFPVACSGGVAVIFADAGTYDVGIRFKRITSGAVTVKERRLAAWVEPF